MVLGANDKNNGGGYSIEDILEEVRRMRKDQGSRPKGGDKPNSGTSPQSSATDNAGTGSNAGSGAGGTTGRQPGDTAKNYGNTSGARNGSGGSIHKSDESAAQDRQSADKRPLKPQEKSDFSLPQPTGAENAHQRDTEVTRPPKTDKGQTDGPPKTGIRRLDRFLVSGGSHTWDSNASSGIAPHALTPDELMKSLQQEQGGRRHIGGDDDSRIMRRTALEGLINSSDDDGSKSRKDRREKISGRIRNSGAAGESENKNGNGQSLSNQPPYGAQANRSGQSDSGAGTGRNLSRTGYNSSGYSANGAESRTSGGERTESGAFGATQEFRSVKNGESVHERTAGERADTVKTPGMSGTAGMGNERERSFTRPASSKIPYGGLDYGLPLVDDEKDYNTIGDAQHIRLGLDRKKSRLGLRSVLTFILFCFSALLAVFDFIGYPFNGITPDIYLLINIGVLAVAAILNITDIIKVFKLFILRATAASASALAVIAALANAIVLYFTDSAPAGGYQLFTAAAMLALFFTVLAEYINISRVRSNFEIIANVDEKSAAFTMDDEYAQALAGNEELGGALVCGFKKAVNIRGFLKNSFKDDPTDSVCSVLTPVILLVAVVAALMMSVLNRSVSASITVFTSVITVSVPLSSALLTAMQLSSASKKLREEFGTIAGYSTVEQYKDVNAVMLGSTDLFPSGSVHLHSIKNFGTVEVDKAILMAAAAAVASGGTLADLFDSVIEGRHGILPRVNAIRYESGRGVVASISGAEIKLGSRGMMEHYAIPVPSAAAERKINQRGAYALYLSVGKNLAAMFIVSYDADDDIADRLSDLVHTGVNLIIHTRDPLITSGMLSQSFKIPEECVRILDDETGKIYRAVSKASGDFSSTIIGRGNISSLCHALVACFKLNGNINFGRVAQLVAIIMAAAVALFVSFSYGVSSFGGIHLLIYQLACALIIIGGTSMRRV